MNRRGLNRILLPWVLYQNGLSFFPQNSRLDTVKGSFGYVCTCRIAFYPHVPYTTYQIGTYNKKPAHLPSESALASQYQEYF
mgnify:FL=1